jgi:uncharacterized membrane protein YhaH (DUF805 family)
MSLMFQPLRRYADFEGRASRSEYWLFTLLLVILAIGFCAAMVIVAVADHSPRGSDLPPAAWAIFGFGALTFIGLFIPALAVTVRRLHDSNNSGFWILIRLVPFGSIVLLIFTLWPGTEGSNQFGPDPRGRPEPSTRPNALVLNTFD